MSTPSYYNEYQRKYLQTLVYRAGFNPIQTLPDYSSAIIAAGIDRLQMNDEVKQDSNNTSTTTGTTNKKYVLIVDLGTWQSTVTICEMTNGLINKIYCTSNDNIESKNVCGIGMDNAILKFCIKNFESRNRGMYIEPENRKSRLKLLREITRIKHTLSSGANQVMFDIESFYEGIDYHFKLSKAKFEMIIYDIIKQIPIFIQNEIVNAQRIMTQIKSNSENFNFDFDYVIAMGGLAQVPKIRDKLNEMFGKKLLNNDFMDRGIASNFINVYGCAIQATTLSYLDLFEKKLKNNLKNQQNNNNNQKNVNPNRANADISTLNGCEKIVAFERPKLNKKNNNNNNNNNNDNPIFESLYEFREKLKMEEANSKNVDKLDESLYYYNCIKNEILGFKNVNDYMNTDFDINILDRNIRLEYNLDENDNENENENDKREILCDIGKGSVLPQMFKIDLNELNIPDTNNIELNVYCCEMDDDCKSVLQEFTDTLVCEKI